MKVIFMGSPQFAVPALAELIASEHQVVAVYTNPPKEAGRGKLINKTPVHMLAEEHGLDVLTPAKLTDPAAIAEFKQLDADIVCVVAYGKILRSEILEDKPLGCLNIHPSDLPKWRGAAPIQRTIMSGDKKTAICIMQMDEGMDTGDILLKEELAITDSMTSAELHDICSKKGAKMLVSLLDRLSQGEKISPQPQSGEPTYANKLTAAEEHINWNQSADAINNLIRALSPKPGAYFYYQEQKIKIITAAIASDTKSCNDHRPGTVINDKLHIKCQNGILKPSLLQREGKKMIYTDAFLRGFPIKPGDILQ